MSARGAWLFGRNVDLAVFGGSFLLSVLLLGVGTSLGLLEGGMPVWGWVVTVVFVDVAHVWATGWRLWSEGDPLRRRPELWLGIPAAAWLAGVMLHAHSSLLFWRVLAYVAVFHFVRQQVGWVALYRRRNGETARLDRWLDEAMVYTSTLFPLVWWHANLPRQFAWFLQGDFVSGLPTWVGVAAGVLHALAATAWVVRQLLHWRAGRLSWGKVLVVATTWCCWFVGIVVFDSDYAFTVTNVLIHGVPYFALVWWHGRQTATASKARLVPLAAFVALPVLFALGEEALWDRFIWDDHPELFGVWGGVLEDSLAALIVPLLALPQAAHYALDAFIWRSRDDDTMRRLVSG